MKLHKKHRENPEPRLIKALTAEQKKGPLIHPIFDDPLARTQEIIDSALKIGMDRDRIREILLSVINSKK